MCPQQFYKKVFILQRNCGALLHESFPQKFPNCACIFGKLEIRTLIPNRFKNQTDNTLKLLDGNSNHQQGFVKHSPSCCIIGLLWTQTFGPVLFQFCVTTAILIKFTQIVIFIKVFWKFLLKSTMMESDFFCLTNSCKQLQLQASSFDVSLV